MQDRTVELIGDTDELFQTAATTATLYLPLLGKAVLVHQSHATDPATPDMARLFRMFQHASEEFDKGRQITAARDVAAEFIPDPSVPDAHLAEFLKHGASLDQLIYRHHEANETDRFNIQRLEAFKDDIEPGDYRILEIIAIDGVHIPTPDGFRPAPPNPTPRKLTELLGNTHAKHYLEAAAKGNCIALDPTFLQLTSLRDCAYKDHNWVDKRRGDGTRDDKGRVCIDPTHVEGGDPRDDAGVARTVRHHPVH